MQRTYTDSPYKAYEANVPADLAGKNNYVVEQCAGSEKIQLFSSGLAIGVLHQQIPGSTQWTVRLLGKGGTVKVVAGGAISTPARVKALSGGKVVDGGGTGRAIGIKTAPAAACADGDVIEIIDVVETL